MPTIEISSDNTNANSNPKTCIKVAEAICYDAGFGDPSDVCWCKGYGFYVDENVNIDSQIEGTVVVKGVEYSYIIYP
jgi:hypothetical protein